MQVSLTRALRVLAGSVSPIGSIRGTAAARLAAASNAGLPVSRSVGSSTRASCRSSSALF